MKIPKLSEAILLGSTLIKWKSGTNDDGQGAGCAIGMAQNALSDVRIGLLYPFMCGPRELPCDCGVNGSLVVGGADALYPRREVEIGGFSCVFHLFNHHVMHAKDWTIEQLCDWVRSIEPAEAPGCAEPAASCTDAVSTGVK